MSDDIEGLFAAPDGVVTEAPVVHDASMARPLDAAAIESVREAAAPKPGRGGARAGAGRKPDPSKKSHHKKVTPAQSEEAPSMTPEQIKLLEASLVRSYEVVLSLLAFAPVFFTDDEREPVGKGIVFCIEAYLPDGVTKHVPAAILLAVSANAVMRARAAKHEKKERQ